MSTQYAVRYSDRTIVCDDLADAVENAKWYHAWDHNVHIVHRSVSDWKPWADPNVPAVPSIPLFGDTP